MCEWMQWRIASGKQYDFMYEYSWLLSKCNLCKIYTKRGNERFKVSNAISLFHRKGSFKYLLQAYCLSPVLIHICQFKYSVDVYYNDWFVSIHEWWSIISAFQMRKVTFYCGLLFTSFKTIILNSILSLTLAPTNSCDEKRILLNDIVQFNRFVSFVPKTNVQCKHTFCGLQT